MIEEKRQLMCFLRSGGTSIQDIQSLPFPRYVRKGKCLRCGKCCLNEDCDHLSFDKHGKATCLLFGKPERPQRCALHPQAPPIIIEGCGYYFLDAWDNNRKLGYMEI